MSSLPLSRICRDADLIRELLSHALPGVDFRGGSLSIVTRQGRYLLLCVFLRDAFRSDFFDATLFRTRFWETFSTLLS